MTRADVRVHLMQLPKGAGGRALHVRVVNAGLGRTAVEKLRVEGKGGRTVETDTSFADLPSDDWESLAWEGDVLPASLEGQHTLSWDLGPSGVFYVTAPDDKNPDGPPVPVRVAVLLGNGHTAKSKWLKFDWGPTPPPVAV